MDQRRRSHLASGLLLILLGAWFLAVQLVPGLGDWLELTLSWPLIVVAVGAVMLVVGLLAGAPGMAVPAFIVGGIGGLLYWQNATGNWASWAYMWTLIPGFAGLGAFVSGAIGGSRTQMYEGARGVLVSFVLFLIFSSFLGGPNLFGPYWPVLLIALGVWLIIRRVIFSSR